MSNPEGFVLNGLNLNNLNGDYVLRTLDLTPPAKKYLWVDGADTDGSGLPHPPLVPNREIAATLRVAQQGSMDLALAKIGAIADQLYEAEQQEQGIPLVWTPATSSKSFTFYVLSGEINGIPIGKEGEGRGWFAFYPLLNIKLYCKPFGYGPEVGTTTEPFTTPIAGALALYTNLITNPSFETGLAGWQAEGPNTNFTTQADAFAGAGAVAARADFNPVAGSYGGVRLDPHPIAAAPGQAFSASVAVKCLAAPAGATMKFQLRWYNGSGGGISQVEATNAFAATAGASGRLSITNAVAPAGTASLDIIPYCLLGATGGTIQMLVDAAIVVNNSTLPAYFDGDQDSAAWNGAANASTSTLYDRSSLSNFVAQQGAGTLQVKGGQLVPTDGTPKLLTWAKGGYDGAGKFYDAQTTLKITTGASVSSIENDLILKYLNASNYLQAFLVSGGGLQLYKNVGGSFTSLATTPVTLVASTSYWFRARIEGNLVTVELWTSVPTPTGTPSTTVTATLTGADAALFGQGVRGLYGVKMNAGGGGTDWRYDDFTIEPNVWVSSAPILTGTLPGIPGDVAAEARLIGTERSNQSRRFLEWGQEWRWLANGTAANGGTMPALLIDSEDLVTTGFAGAQATLTGAYRRSGATHDTVHATLTTSPTAVCGTGNLPHVGTYRVRCRCNPSTTGVTVRLSWQDGSGIFRANDFQIPPVAGTFVDLDLGLITITPAVSGTQQWSGRIEAQSTAAGDTIDIDHLVLVPVDSGYGKARGQYSYLAGAIVGRDSFVGAAGALNTRTADAGGAWATSGVATDFSAAANPAREFRSTAVVEATPRWALLGSTNFTDAEGQVSFASINAGTILGAAAAVVLRWTNSSNYAFFEFNQPNPSSSAATLKIGVVVAGTTTILASKSVTWTSPDNGVLFQWSGLRFVCYGSGQCHAWLLSTSGAPLAQLDATSTALATGGALATGLPGFYDQALSTSAAVRRYSNFTISTPTAELIALYAGRTFEVRSDVVKRQDSGGTTLGDPPSYRGAHLFVPPAGAAARTSRVLVKADRNDIETSEDVPLGDTLQVQVVVTPRYLAVPR